MVHSAIDTGMDPENAPDELFAIARAIHRYGIAQSRRDQEKLEDAHKDMLKQLQGQADVIARLTQEATLANPTLQHVDIDRDDSDTNDEFEQSSQSLESMQLRDEV